MKTRVWVIPVFFLSVLLSSCFNNTLRTPKETAVTFYLDEPTVKQIAGSAVKSKNASRGADDETSPELFIDVTLCGEVEQTQTASLTNEVKIEFKDVLVNSKVYAKAEIYQYADSEKTVRELVYRGESKKITVREDGNILTINLTAAKLTVTFETNGGSLIEPVTVVTGNAVEEPEKPVKPADKKKYSRENFAFAGWYKDEELTQTYDFSLPVKNDITLYAKWIPDFVFVEGATVNNYLATGRNIKISDLYVSDHEVTQAEYKAITNENPSNNKGADDLPVENVTWFEAIEYCNKLSEKEGLTPCYKINGSEVTCSLSANGYRLPTEAEWEYIAGKAERTNVDFDRVVLHSSNSAGKTQKEDNRLVDELCLSNLLGNVAEWCFDVYSDSIAKTAGATGPMAVAGTTPNRVVRGGSYKSEAATCTSSTRSYANPTEKNEAIGFRVVRTVVYEFKVVHDTVTFDSDGGTEIELQIIVEGDCAVEPANPTKRGYTFQGWQFADAAFDFSTPVTQDITLTAKWTPITYKVLFNYNTEQVSGGSGTVTSFDATYDQVIQLPAASTITAPTGWHFKKWSLASDPAAVDFEYDLDNPQIKNLTITQGAEVTLYAIWEENGKHTITYNNADYPGVDISGLKVEFREAESVNLQAQTPSGTRTGYTFEGWFESADIDGNGDGPEVISWAPTEKTTDVVVYARWTANEYEITYVTNDGTWKDGFTPDSKYTYNVAKSLPGSDKLIRAGFGLHWLINGTEVTEIAAGTIGPVTVTANWIAGEVNYTVHHMKQNVDGTNYDEDLDANGDPQLLSGRTGDTTAATARSYEGFTVQDFTQETIAGDGSTEIIIFYTRNTHTVTYASGLNTLHGIVENSVLGLLLPTDNPTGIPSGSTDYRYGAIVRAGSTTAPTLAGYEFDCWIDDDGVEGSNTYSAAQEFTLPDRDVVLTAKWKPYTSVWYDIKYMLQNIDDDDYSEDTSASKLGTTGGTTNANNPVDIKTYSGFDMQEIEEQIIKPEDYSTKVYVYYNRKTYTVIYDKNCGSETVTGDWPTDSTSYRYQENVILPDVSLSRTGYTFAGWTKFANPADNETVYNYDDNAEHKGPMMIPTNADTDTTMTLYAKWTVETQGTGIDVGFGVDTSTITVDQSGGVFTATPGYTSYVWKIDGSTPSMSYLDVDTPNVLDLSTINVPGVYDITLTATKTVDGNTVTHTWTGQYIKN